MILIAQNVLDDIAGRSKRLKQTLLTEGTLKLPGFEAYEAALKKRSAGRTRPRPAASPTTTGTSGAKPAKG